MSTDHDLSPKGSRIAIAFAGCMAAGIIPVVIPLALGLTVSGDAVWVLLAVVLVYSVFFLYLIGRLGQWAARLEPAAGVALRPLDDVRRRLLALNDGHVSFHVYDAAPDHLVVEWTSRGETSRAVRRVHLRFKDHRHQVRVVETHAQVEWTDARSLPRWRGSFQFFRGIELSADPSKRPLVAAVLQSGWTWQPVIFR